ncbi:putative calcyphosin protein [Paratrimastix pyriformis]|uniref:Calcyphosin protein n=1 Tax=Paratrimastix pyriformis TaxID=342808 RepID=A0ABQ8U7I7_9EUKA|nr:putative calcyphosin protein [Paratrimastix pyriformis]
MASLESFKQQLAARGLSGTIAIGRQMRRASTTGQRALDRPGFAEFCADLGINLTPAQREELFALFDQEPTDGTVDLSEFLAAIAPHLTADQEALVRQAFQKLDANHSNEITLEDIRPVYDAKHHPKVMKGEMTEEQALAEWVQILEGGRGNRDGRISYEEFLAYYQSLSSNFLGRPGMFEEMMRSCWKL